ncbi:unnamed protein product [Blepharisma stoltei]|uniref:Uncharacterized protein n=1 Tax=Blepharisma stoltei TaxID=1481888 RepID=A0AAU9IBT2_9CILI|nr:unnamed protein product [Blepharisma stoltei]
MAWAIDNTEIDRALTQCLITDSEEDEKRLRFVVEDGDNGDRQHYYLKVFPNNNETQREGFFQWSLDEFLSYLNSIMKLPNS